MILPGLVSVTVRALFPAEICRLCERAKLRCIEWGGDVHVPPDGRSAPEVRRMSADAGLEICAYGSYFRFHGQPSALHGRGLRAWRAADAHLVRKQRRFRESERR